ncbi:MAG TPA: SDR family oxidoreductase [Acidimicrobiia bacterium]|jgi:NAD(P)-dependent dehydrogenase (short-subunit alcohol dehydrogenase family)
MRRFDGKVVVVTGGGAGIGRTYAHRFAAEGAAVVIADLDGAAATRVVDEVAADGGRGLAHVMDVTDADAAAAMVDRATAELGGVDLLVNNAGIHLDHAQLPFTLDAVPQWRAVLDVNVIGALIGAAACRPAMAARGGGAIVNMSSMAAYGGTGAYGVSKLALNSLTVSLASDFAADGIRVNGIAPGLVDSEAAVEWWSDPARAGMEGIDQMLIGQQMIKRQGTMHDLAEMCLFLCSEAASFVTGQTILVDGGFTKKPY